MLFFVIIMALFVVVDQVIKVIIRNNLTPDAYIEVVPNLIHLTYQENQGISFSMLADLPLYIRVPLLSGVSLLVIIGLFIYIFKKWNHLNQGEKWGFILILSGAIGNLIDRALRGQVTDYMFFHFYDTSFFVNNFADDLISIGFVLIIWQSFRKTEIGHET